MRQDGLRGQGVGVEGHFVQHPHPAFAHGRGRGTPDLRGLGDVGVAQGQGDRTCQRAIPVHRETAIVEHGHDVMPIGGGVGGGNDHIGRPIPHADPTLVRVDVDAIMGIATPVRDDAAVLAAEISGLYPGLDRAGRVVKGEVLHHAKIHPASAIQEQCFARATYARGESGRAH